MGDPYHRVTSVETALLTASTVMVRSVAAADWFPFLDIPQGRYGWTYPMRDGALADLVMHVCPELIVKQTAHLDDRDLFEYVGTISWMAEKYLSLLGDRMDSPTTLEVMTWQGEIESELYDLSPHALQITSKVQLSVLDS